LTKPPGWAYIKERQNMTGWDALDTLMKTFLPLVATVLLIAAGVIFIIGFSRRE
jgi:hypothetical protein